MKHNCIFTVIMAIAAIMTTMSGCKSEPELPANHEYVGDNKVCLSSEASIVRHKGSYNDFEVVSGDGYISEDGCYCTDRCRVPDGEIWVIDDYELAQHFDNIKVTWDGTLFLYKSGCDRAVQYKCSKALRQVQLYGGDEFLFWSPLRFVSESNYSVSVTFQRLNKNNS